MFYTNRILISFNIIEVSYHQDFQLLISEIDVIAKFLKNLENYNKNLGEFNKIKR